MKAEINPRELGKLLVLITKDVRGKKARDRAVVLLSFEEDAIKAEFTDIGVSCPAKVTEKGAYALNPFVLRNILETFSNKNVILEIDKTGVRIGGLRVGHARLNGHLHDPYIAVQLWQNDWGKQQDRKAKTRQKEDENKQSKVHQEELWSGRRVDFRRPGGQIEHGAVILRYERGVQGNRKVLVKTRDFQEVWISELEIVNFDLEAKLDVKGV